MEQNMIQTLDVLRRETKVLTFDQYGTIVDMQQGLTEVVTPFLKRKGWDGKPNNFVTWWRRTHFENSMIDALSLLGCRSRVGHQHQPKEGSHVGFVADRSDPEIVRRQG